MIVDANLAVYWFVPTELSASAARLLLRSDLKSPAILEIELVSALTKYVRAQLISEQQFRDAVVETRKAITEFVPDRPLLDKAINISLANNHSIYDCLYLALAMDRSEPLATADRRLATLARSLGVETLFIHPT